MGRILAALGAVAVVGAGAPAAEAARPSVPVQSVGQIAAAGKATVLVARGRGRARVTASLTAGDLVVATGRPRVVRLSPRRSRRIPIAIPRDDRWALSTCAAPGTVVVRVSARAGRRLRRARRAFACPPARSATGRAALAELPVLDPLTHVAQSSSHARDGTNSDSGHDLGTDAQGRHVLLDATGPGAITRLWFTSSPDDSGLSGDPSDIGRIQIFFDGESTPRVDLPAPELFSGRHAPFLAPLCGNYLVSSGGDFCDVRMPYRKSVRVVVTKTTYYDIGYETYPAGTPVTTFDPGSADGRGEAALYARAGSDPDVLPPGRATEGTATLAAGARRAIAAFTGGGTIRDVEVGIDPGALRDVWLEARWDGEDAPSVAAPLADLFLSGAGERAPATGLLAGYAPARHAGYLRFPMPFASTARLELVNRGTAPAGARWTVERTGARYAGVGTWAGRFHATYEADPATAAGSDVTLLDAPGAGKVVGVSYTEQGPTNSGFTQFMEGDERVHFDGSRSPAVYGTGTEDFFSGGYYYNHGRFSLPDHGLTAKEDVLGGGALTSQYRLLAQDPWPFRDGVHLGIEHAAGDGLTTAVHSVVLWYGTGRRGLRATGSVDVGGEPVTGFFEGDRDGNVSSAQDDLVLSGAQPPAAGSDPRGEAVTASGRTHAAGDVIRFTLPVDPGNAGVVLRRLFDQSIPDQRAAVSVDGRPAGEWLTAGANPFKRLAESDFALPATLTAGRSRIDVALRVLSSGGWSDDRYTALSVNSP
jgi:D-arabinan exo alpha-(1,3)/(1,5)-arabinofuranosidase (non-reducing end)